MHEFLLSVFISPALKRGDCFDGFFLPPPFQPAALTSALAGKVGRTGRLLQPRAEARSLEFGHFGISAARGVATGILPVKLVSEAAQDRQECLSLLEMSNL